MGWVGCHGSVSARVDRGRLLSADGQVGDKFVAQRWGFKNSPF